MGVSILDNWQYLGKKPDFTRQLFETVADMVAFNENYLPPVYECNVIEDGCRYRYQLTNDLDPVLGRWRKVEGGSGTVEEAEDVGYENEKLPDVEDIKQALDEIVDQIYYVLPEITSFTMTPPTEIYENGEVINSLTFDWAYNKDMVSQELTDCVIADETVRTVNYDTPLTTNKTFILNALDEKNGQASKSVTITFLDRIYYGSAPQPTDYDSAFILALSDNKLTDDKKGSYTLNVNSGEYGYLAIPIALGTVDSANIGGFVMSLDNCGVIDFTNAHGYTTPYGIYKTAQRSLGDLTMEVM